IDTTPLQERMPLSKVLEWFRRLAAERGKEVPILIRKTWFREENPDAPEVEDTQVEFPPMPRRMAFGHALAFALSRVPTNNATYLVKPGYLEITTVERAALPRLLSQRVSVRFGNVSLAEALRTLAEAGGISVVVDSRLAGRTRTPVYANLPSEISLGTALFLLA